MSKILRFTVFLFLSLAGILSAQESTAGTTATEVGITEDSINEQREKAELAERLSLEKAQYLRRIFNRLGPERTDVAERMREQLREVVKEAFDAQQKLQRMEATAIRQKADKLLEALDRREAQQNQVIGRRIDELLEPEFDWEPKSKPSSAQVLSPESESKRPPKASGTFPPTSGQPTRGKSSSRDPIKPLESARMESQDLFRLKMEEQRYLNSVGETHPALAAIREQIKLVEQQIAKLRKLESARSGDRVRPLESDRMEAEDLFRLKMEEQRYLNASGEGHPALAAIRQQIKLVEQTIAKLRELEKAPRTETAQNTPSEVVPISSDSDSSSSTEFKRLAVFSELAETEEYKLAEGQELKRIPPPFNDVRERYSKKFYNDRLSSMLINWSGNNSSPGPALTSTPAGPGRVLLQHVLLLICGVGRNQIESDDDTLLNLAVTGDWVKNANLTDVESVTQLQKILSEELNMPVHLELREVERDVYVARGKYVYTPVLSLPFETLDRYRSDRIVVFGGQPPKYVSGPMDITAGLVRFLNELSSRTNIEIHNEVSEGPRNNIAWKYVDRPEDSDPEQVLPNITAQTGIAFTKETRLLKRLFVSRVEKQ